MENSKDRTRQKKAVRRDEMNLSCLSNIHDFVRRSLQSQACLRRNTRWKGEGDIFNFGLPNSLNSIT